MEKFMFEQLKSKVAAGKEGALKIAGHGLSQSAVDALMPKVAPIFAMVCDLAPSVVADEAKYRSLIVEPAWIAASAMTGGLASAIPDLHQRFDFALIHARDELLVVDTTTERVTLVDGAMSRLPQVLLEGLKKPVSHP
jgi:hypothetical protein